MTDDEPAWHERTSTVVGASVAAVAVIGLLWLLISYVTGGSDDPGSSPQYYPDPSVSGLSSFSSSSTTSNTETITSTSPPMTTDISPGDTTTTTTTSGTDTSSSETTTTPSTTSQRSTTYGGPSTSRQRPRLNETRTLYPRP